MTNKLIFVRKHLGQNLKNKNDWLGKTNINWMMRVGATGLDRLEGANTFDIYAESEN
ncbi:hypothetical protein HA147_06040 [Prochlorococcus marinus XMU1410]|uniref:hypothetical protein n=1 Tax=Prochlorococcus marinus TaxID=1219 RepID=UPI001ADCFCBC|nr:hypothetical protein [Prochlorococcus marinus]MBO8242208.1 hypothetical protein [Prochlorococcus marinus XMU1410]